MKKKQLIPDKNYYGCIDDVENPKTQAKYLKQYKTRGFDDTELWGLDYVIASFVLPRLKAFTKLQSGWPGNLEQKDWLTILNKIIFALELVKKDNIPSITNYKKMQEGLELFGKYFTCLWD